MGQSPNSINYTNNPNDPILVQGNADMKNGTVSPRVWTTQITKTAQSGDFILSVRAPVGDVGKTDYDVVLGRGVAGIHGTEFIYQILIKMKLFNYWGKLATGSTFESINSNDIQNAEINIPMDLNEQKYIGDFLKSVDDLIHLQTEQLSLYESLKEYLLQRLFPLNEEHTPNVRFANFEDDWKLSKLGNYVDFINGRAYKQSELLDKGKYKVLRVGNFNTNPRWYYSNLDLDSNKYAKKGDLLYLWATNFGPKIWHEEKVIYHYHIWKLDLLKDTLDKIYLFYWLEVDKKRIGKDLNGTTMVHITKETMENRILNVPENIFEQKKLGILLNTVTNLIELYQKQLSSYESLKNYYLQKLFI